MRTTVTFEGNLADDPQVRFTGRVSRSPNSPCRSTSAQQGSDGEWIDGEPTRHVVRAFKTLAENVVESLAKGIGSSCTGP